MQLILETTSNNYYLPFSNGGELLLVKSNFGVRPEWVYTIPEAEHWGIVQRDAEGNHIVVGTERNIQLRQVIKVSSRF
jgi:hypothetical protein